MFLIYKTFVQAESWRFNALAVIGLSNLSGKIS